MDKMYSNKGNVGSTIIGLTIMIVVLFVILSIFSPARAIANSIYSLAREKLGISEKGQINIDENRQKEIERVSNFIEECYIDKCEEITFIAEYDGITYNEFEKWLNENKHSSLREGDKWNLALRWQVGATQTGKRYKLHYVEIGEIGNEIAYVYAGILPKS